ncbi:hypothetical protein [Pseudomonas bharatica]|uniref:hypothetical protein n=1 Tax=Pseudomonas bharatica TaxID=2692112 RepID=UPI001F036C1F|nr:hypothetical protein [Pseudomonas bharatica]
MSKISNRVRHGRRQQFIHLPPSGLGGAYGEQGQSEGCGVFAPGQGEEEGRGCPTRCRVRCVREPAGIKKLLAAEVKAHGYDQVQALWQDMALSWAAADPEERARRLQRPDAPAFYISPKLARQFESSSMAELKRFPGCEVIPPDC